MSQRVNLTAKFPPGDDENSADYTRRLLSHAREAGTNRQCSIGYHEECSDPYGESCMCTCHALGIELTRDQLQAWAGRELTDEEVEQIDEAIQHSSIPEAINTIADSLT
jgi:hypothetical protein